MHNQLIGWNVNTRQIRRFFQGFIYFSFFFHLKNENVHKNEDDDDQEEEEKEEL